MKFWIGAAVVAIALVAMAALVSYEYFFFAGYTVLMFVVLATAWNILGGYAGYVNFGTPAFFGLGAYSAAVLYKA
ncbi:MAG TPA: branched-chain amino acid ABC transporter permease, partial [Burkholderiales bacterium]|nr:branched-chain amino acid ABC transporter permease [Burkholderiales bacterium]